MWTARVLGNAAVVRAINTLKEEGYGFNYENTTFYVMEPTEKYAKKFSDEMIFLNYLLEHMSKNNPSSYIDNTHIENKIKKETDSRPSPNERRYYGASVYEWMNPLDWSRQHQVALALAVFIGAALAMAWGGNWNSVTRCVKYGYQCDRARSTLYWGIFGGVLGASTIYVVRLMRSEAPVEPSFGLKAAVGMVVPLEVSGPLFLQAELQRLGVPNVPLPFCEQVVADLIASSIIDPETDISSKADMVDRIERTSGRIARLCRGDMPPSEMATCEDLVRLMGSYRVNRIPWRGSERA